MLPSGRENKTAPEGLKNLQRLCMNTFGADFFITVFPEGESVVLN
jgi:hypothetical protein